MTVDNNTTCHGSDDIGCDTGTRIIVKRHVAVIAGNKESEISAALNGVMEPVHRARSDLRQIVLYERGPWEVDVVVTIAVRLGDDRCASTAAELARAAGDAAEQLHPDAAHVVTTATVAAGKAAPQASRAEMRARASDEEVCNGAA